MSTTSYPSPVSSAGSPNPSSNRSEAYIRLFELPDLPGRSEFGPNHEAIVLTGEDADRTRLPSVPSGALERLRQFELTAEIERRTASTRLNSPVSPPRQSSIPRRALLESQLIRLTEESSTFLGRHVAREAGGSNPNELYRRFERGLETFRSFARQRLSEPVAESNNHRTENERSAHSLDVNVLRSAQLTASPTSIRGTMNFSSSRTRRPLRTESRQPSTPSSGSQMDRLSLLSNLSVQNLTTPTAISSRPLLFDDSSSYVSSPVEEDESRNYYIRRRTNAQGDEIVHSIALDLEEPMQAIVRPIRRPTGALRPSQPHGNVPSVVIPSSDRMRRSWGELILDPDGDVPAEEEDSEGPDSRRRNQLPGLLIPLTRSSFSPDDDTDELPRVRLNVGLSPRDSEYYGAAIDNSIECRRKTQPLVESFGSDTPFCADPLPMPLEKMMTMSPSGEGIPVHNKLAVLAGR